MDTVRLLIAEDHRRMRAKVISTLSADYAIVGAVGDGQEMLDAEVATRPDVVILDISMPTVDGIEAAYKLRRRSPAAKIIFLTVHEEQAFVEAALATGALGYVIKSRMASDLRLAVEEALAGRQFVSPSVLRAGKEACAQSRRLAV